MLHICFCTNVKNKIETNRRFNTGEKVEKYCSLNQEEKKAKKFVELTK